MRHSKKIITWLLLGTLSASVLAGPAFSAESATSEPEAQSEPAQVSPDYTPEISEPSPVEQGEPESQEEPSDSSVPDEQPQDEPSDEGEASSGSEPSSEQGAASGQDAVYGEENASGTETGSGEELSAEDAASAGQDAGDFATETVVSSYSQPSAADDSGWATNPSGSIGMTLQADDVSKSVAEAGYFPSRADVLNGRVSGIFTASMILWHRDNGASCYRIKDTTTFADAFGGTAVYTPRPGDLIYYQAYQDEYDAGILTSGNSNWLHVGIVAEVGEDYITTIEGNTSQRVSKLTLSRTRGVIGRYTDYRRSWIVNIFGDDDEAREAYVGTAWQAWYDAEEDARNNRSGFGTWRESRYNGVYQNDTIASGYFKMPAAWCEMFVLWCAFNADVIRTGVVSVVVNSNDRAVLSIIAQGQSLGGYEFSFYPVTEDADYASMEPSFVITTDFNGEGESPQVVYGTYHAVQTGGDELSLPPLEFTLEGRDICLVLSIGEDEAEDADGIVSALVDNLLSGSTTGHVGRMYVPELSDNQVAPVGMRTSSGSEGSARSTAPAPTPSAAEASSAPVERAAGAFIPLTDATSVLHTS